MGEDFAHFANRFPQFYDPTQDDTPVDATVVPVVWPAFPGSLRGTLRERLELADGSRDLQDEYCEWAVERNTDGKVTRVTFTTETPEYFEHLFATDPDELFALYQKLIGPQVNRAGLEVNGSYLDRNEWNACTSGRPAHLVQGSNTLVAAVTLAAEATILRERNGFSVTGNEDLVACGGLGEPSRNSDPSIAATVNDAARSGAEITLRDPVGLYIDDLMTGDMTTPDGEDPRTFWHVERGDVGHTLRAFFEVPKEQNRGYVVGDIEIGGQPIAFGAQLAIRVRVRLEAVAKPAGHRPNPQPCVAD